MAIYDNLKNGHVKWVVMPNFKTKANRGMLQAIKKGVGIYNAANSDSKIQIIPLSFMEAASRIFCLHLELLSSNQILNKLVGDHCLKEVTVLLAKENPFLCIGLDKYNLILDPLFSPNEMPIVGVFVPRDESKHETQFIPNAQLSIEDELVRKLLLPLWQNSSNSRRESEITICGRISKLTAYYFIDPLNTNLKVGTDRSPTERSNLNYIEPAYLFKDKLLR